MGPAEERGYPIPAGEEERLGDLYATGILDSAPERTYDDLTRIAAEICRVPLAAITFIDQERQWVKARTGDVDARHRRESFCARAIMQPEEVLTVEDATQHPDLKDSTYVVDEPHIRFYAGAPIQSPRGHGLGAVCVLDTEPGTITEGQREALAALSRMVGLKLELRRIGQQHRRAQKDLENLSRAISEDLQNTTQGIADRLGKVLDQAAALPDEVEEEIRRARDQTLDLGTRTSSLTGYLDIARGPGTMETFALREALGDAKDSLAEAITQADAHVEGHGLPIVAGQKAQITEVLRQLIRNALDHAGHAPRIDVTATRKGDRWTIIVRDDGPGFDLDDPIRLTRMFERGAQGNGRGGAGMGLAICRRIIEGHGGQIALSSSKGEGAVVTFTLPGPEAA